MIRESSRYPKDKIFLNDFEFYGPHGVLETEKINPQKFIIDICLYLDLSLPGRTDDLKLTIDYSAVYGMVKVIVETQSFNLIEALANAIANKIISSFSVNEVMITVKKPNAPIEGASFSSVAVQISRKKTNTND